MANKKVDKKFILEQFIFDSDSLAGKMRAERKSKSPKKKRLLKAEK